MRRVSARRRWRTRTRARRAAAAAIRGALFRAPRFNLDALTCRYTIPLVLGAASFSPPAAAAAGGRSFCCFGAAISSSLLARTRLFRSDRWSEGTSTRAEVACVLSVECWSVSRGPIGRGVCKSRRELASGETALPLPGEANKGRRRALPTSQHTHRHTNRDLDHNTPQPLLHPASHPSPRARTSTPSAPNKRTLLFSRERASPVAPRQNRLHPAQTHKSRAPSPSEDRSARLSADTP